MKKAKRVLAILVAWLALVLLASPQINAQALLAKPAISFDSFTATYHLSRDAQSRSLLTTEEVILADFPSNSNFSGITRSIPKTYQGHGVDIKVLNVTDAGGSVVPYKLSLSGENLVITTGDPSITLYGPQTFRLTYQTAGVIDIKTADNTLLLDINGRGWDQSIQKVSGIVQIPTSIAANLSAKPGCYIGYLTTVTYDCTVNNQNKHGQIQVSAQANQPLAPHTTLVMKLIFKSATFTNSKNTAYKQWLGLGVIVLLGSLYSLRMISRRR